MPQPSGRKGPMAKTGRDVAKCGQSRLRPSDWKRPEALGSLHCFQSDGRPTQRPKVSFNGNGRLGLCLRSVRARRASRIPHRDHCDRTTGLGVDLKGHICNPCVSEPLDFDQLEIHNSTLSVTADPQKPSEFLSIHRLIANLPAIV